MNQQLQTIHAFESDEPVVLLKEGEPGYVKPAAAARNTEGIVAAKRVPNISEKMAAEVELASLAQALIKLVAK